MSGELHSPLIHHALREVGGIGRVVRREYTEELVPAGGQAVVVADVGEELERRRRGRDGGEDDVLVGREAVPGLLQAGDPPAGPPRPRPPPEPPAPPRRGPSPPAPRPRGP